MKIGNIMKKSWTIKSIFFKFGEKGFLEWINPKLYLKIYYKFKTGEKLNLNSPKTFNEKLQWIKLYDHNPDYNIMVDKYAVREYVAKTIGEEYLILLIGTYDSVDEIDWSKLPNKFVLKCTHGSGSNIICTDKDKLDIEYSKVKLNKWMKKNWYWFGKEWPYKNVKPRIIAEKYMADETGIELKDYKVLCFNGEPKLIEVHRGRFANRTQDIYDIGWNKTEISQSNIGIPKSKRSMEKPVFLDEMLFLSCKLSQKIPHVRVDWYYADNQLFFGELTFFDGSGFDRFDNPKDDLMLGSWINLTEYREAEF